MKIMCSNSSKSLALFTIILVFSCFMININCADAEFSAKQPIKGFYWIQKMYPGNDPIENVKESEFHTIQKYFEVNDEMIFYAKNAEKREDVEDSVNLVDLFDEKVDNIKSGNCCKRITYEEFAAGNDLSTIIPAIPATAKSKAAISNAKAKANKVSAANKLNPIFAPSLSTKSMKKIQKPKLLANFCILLHVPDEARWRICHENQNMISKLQLKIIYSILKAKSNNKASTMENFINNVKVGNVEDIGKWNWDSQHQWGGKCQTSYMQSPMNIKTAGVQKPSGDFSISMHLTDVHTLIKRNYQEIIVAFLNFGGILKLAIDNTYLLFTPQFMSFRFPSEVILDGQRFDGDIQLHFAELSSQRVFFIN